MADKKDIKIKQRLEPPQQAASYVVDLPQPPVRNAEEYLKAYIGYVYTAVGAIAQEVASIDLHLYKITFTRGKPKTQEVFEHPILSALDYINQMSTFYDIVEATQTYLELTGEAFWVMLKDNTGTPQEVWLLRPDWVKVIPSLKEVVDHYNYYPGGVMSDKVEIPKENVIPFKYFHPLNPYRGKGATQAAALPFDILNFAQEYNRNFFFNSAIPSMIFTTDQKVNEQTAKRFLAQWQTTFGGRSKSNKIAFLGNGLKLDKASASAKELDFTEQMKQMRDDVLAVFKVPKTVLGLTEDVNRANADATTRAFMERVITPRMRKFVDTLNEFFVPAFSEGEEGYFLDFTDPSPEDVELKLKRYENGRKYGWLTANEIRSEENLEPLPGGDDLSASSENDNQVSVDDEETPNNTPDPNEDVEDEPVKPTGDEEEPKGLRAQLAKLFGVSNTVTNKTYIPPKYLSKPKPVKHMVKIPTKRLEQLKREQLAGKFVQPLTKFIGELLAQDDYSPLKKEKNGMSKEKQEELAKLIAEGLKKETKKVVKETKGSGWTEEAKTAYWRQFIAQVTDKEEQVKETAQTIFKEQEKLVLERLEDRMKAWRKRLGIKATASQVVPTLEELSKMWLVLEQLLREVYIEQGNSVMDFLGVGGNIDITTEFASRYLVEYGGTLIKGINETTREALMKTLSEGFDQGESVAKLSKRVRDVFDQADKNRAELIARTETIKATNAATVEAYRQSQVVVGKEWLTERDNRTCPFCQELDGKVVALNANYFNKGDSLTVGGQTLNFNFTDVGEPPAHGNCRCTTIPVIGSVNESLQTKAQNLHSIAKSQNDGFQSSVDVIAVELGATVKHGPVKSLERIIEKLENEYADTLDPISHLMDANRATIIISNPNDFNKVVNSVSVEFGNVVRVKDKFDKPGYKSAIINVMGKDGAIAEIAVTTPEMWAAKEEGGGHKLYELVRTGQDPTGKFKEKMDRLYEEAQQAIEDRLGI